MNMNRSLMNILNNIGPTIEPSDIPLVTSAHGLHTVPALVRYTGGG